jgi:hypothetical protein
MADPLLAQSAGGRLVSTAHEPIIEGPSTGNDENHHSAAAPLACPLTARRTPAMITHDARRSLSRGNNPVPSPWLAAYTAGAKLAAGRPCCRAREIDALYSARLDGSRSHLHARIGKKVRFFATR